MNIAINAHTLPILLVLITAILVNAVFGLLVLMRTFRRVYGWYFMLTLMGVAAWSLGDVLLLLGRNTNVTTIGAELFYIGPMIIPAFIWFFARTFPTGKLRAWPVVLSAVLFSTFSVLFLTKLGWFAHIQIGHTINTVTPQKPAFLLYAGYFSLFFILAYISFLIKMRETRGVSRTQISYTFYGALGASVPALISNLSLPVMGMTGAIWLGPIFTLFFTVAVTAAIVKHRLFDLRFYVVRSAAYFLALTATVGLYIVLAAGLTTFALHSQLKSGTTAVLSLITLFVALLFQPLKRFFDKLTNRLFYRDAYDPQVFIDELNRVLVANVRLDKLLTQASDVIVKNLKADYCLFGIRETKFRGQRIYGGTGKRTFTQQDIAAVRHITPHFDTNVIVADYLGHEQAQLHRILDRNDIAALVRLTPSSSGRHEGIGYIVLGTKKSGNSYGTQDIKMLDIISRELLIAIQNALHFEEIENFNVTLQERVDEATKKLRRTNEKLKILDQTKDDFISMASHQLRTPLTSVKGYVSMVLDGDAGSISPLQRKLLNQSFISAQRMVYLISDLLNVSRLRTGKFIIEPVATNLANVVKDEIDQLIETAASRNLQLVYHKPEHFPPLMLDETKIRQVIMNFIDNAIYYTPSGGHIMVNLTETPKSIEFTVVDDGIGVPKHEQPHLFSKFYRAQNAQRARPDGTGLGLFMAKKVIVAQGGAIIFKSIEGKGSTFGFTFAKGKLPALDTEKV